MIGSRCVCLCVIFRPSAKESRRSGMAQHRKSWELLDEMKEVGGAGLSATINSAFHLNLTCDGFPSTNRAHKSVWPCPYLDSAATTPTTSKPKRKEKKKKEFFSLFRTPAREPGQLRRTQQQKKREKKRNSQ